MVCPSGLEENLQGQEYGISAMQGAELNLPAGGLGRHHYGHTPRWPGAQHMMGCWEYTAMRPLACRKSEMKLVDLLESIENLPQKIVPRSRVTVLFNIETIWTKWEIKQYASKLAPFTPRSQHIREYTAMRLAHWDPTPVSCREVQGSLQYTRKLSQLTSPLSSWVFAFLVFPFFLAKMAWNA